MSLIKANAVQIGQSPTATQNFTLAVPSSPDGTIKLARGNSGATTQDVMNVSNAGVVSFPQGLGNISNSTAIATGSTTARSLANRFADTINVKDFGAVGDGIADDTAAIQAAVNSLGVNGGKIEFNGEETYLLGVVSITKNNTFLNGNFSKVKPALNANCFEFYNPSNQLQNIKIENFVFESSSIRSGGSCIKLLNTKDSTIKNCKFNNQCNGIEIAGSGTCFISNCSARDFAGSFIWIDGGDGFFISDCTCGNSSTQPNSNGILVNAGGGIYISDSDFTTANNGIYFYPNNISKNVSWVFINNVSVDTCNYGLLADANIGSIRSIHTSNFWSASNEEDGVRIIGVDGYSSVNDRYFFNKKHGLFLGGNTIRVKLNNNIFANNSTTTLSGYDGLLIDSNVDQISIIGNYFGNDYVNIGVNNQRYGINTIPSSLGNIIIQSNNFQNNLSSDINWQRSLTSENIIIKDNQTNKTKTIASASTIAIDIVNDIIYVSGTTQVQNANLCPKGKEIKIMLTGINSIQNGFNFGIGSNFSTNPDGILTLISTGSIWREVSRKTL
jgi:parallel beta-helix repeat protein